MKRGLGFGVSLLVALGIHAAILLVPRVVGQGDPVPTIEVDFASAPADPGPGTTQPAAARKGGARLAVSPATPAPPVAAPAEPASSRELAAPPAPADATDPSAAASPDPAPSNAAAPDGAEPAEGTSPEGSGSAGAGAASAAASASPGRGGTGTTSVGFGGTGEEEAPAASTTSVPRPRGEILPEYPRVARRAGWVGVVTIRAVVDEMGKVVSAEVLVSSGHSSLDMAALEAVKSWPFSPARRGGRPVSSPVNIPVRFTLN